MLLIVVGEGAALGGGFGLVCVSDVAFAEAGCLFGMPEVTLGLVPAQIAPFVRARIGLTQTRRLALTGEMIDGRDARKLGLVHHSERGADALDKRLKKLLKQSLKAAPGAVSATKALLASCGETVTGERLDAAAQAFTGALLSEEGREGTTAFAQKRPAAWMEMPT
jgi:isohexenylglutaconyl-CoA hydratase